MKINFIVKILILFLFTIECYSQEVFEKNFATFSEFLTEQNNKLSTIENNFSLIDVENIMGSSISVKIPKTGKMKPLNQLFKQPEFTKKIVDKTEKGINILWYFSTPKNQDGIVSKSECTPIVFKNDSVIGKGTKFYLTFMKKSWNR